MATNKNKETEVLNNQVEETQIEEMDDFGLFLVEAGATADVESPEQKRWRKELTRLREHLNDEWYGLLANNPEVLNCQTPQAKQDKKNAIISQRFEVFFKKYPQFNDRDTKACRHIKYEELKKLVAQVTAERDENGKVISLGAPKLPSEAFKEYKEISQQAAKDMQRGIYNPRNQQHIAIAQDPSPTAQYRPSGMYSSRDAARDTM